MMRRWGFHLACLLSSLLFLFAIITWARSYAPESMLFESYRGQFLIIGIDAGSRSVWEMRNVVSLESFLVELRAPVNLNGKRLPSGIKRSFAGFTLLTGGVGTVPIPGTGYSRFPDFWIVGVPHWFVALLALPIPLLWLRYFRRMRRRTGSNRCVKCGYDLRATPDRCPECGATPEISI